MKKKTRSKAEISNIKTLKFLETLVKLRVDSFEKKKKHRSL